MIDAVGARRERERPCRRRDDEIAADLGEDARDALAARRFGVGEPFREALEARQPEGGDARVAVVVGEDEARGVHQLGVRVGRQVIGVALREAAHDLVHHAAAQGGVGVLAEHRQLFELEDVAGEDLVRVLQPGFDARDAHLARAQLQRRSRLGRADARQALRVIAHAGPAEPRLVGLQRVEHAEAGEQRLQPHQPARRHGRHAVDLLGAGDVDAARRRAAR